MKTRDPQTFPGAVEEVIKGLGADGAGASLSPSRSARHIHRWADPDEDSLPGLEQAVSLDAAFMNAGLGEGPLLRVYTARLAARAPGAAKNVGSVLAEMLDLPRAHAELADFVRDIVAPHSEDGEKISEREMNEGLRRIQRFREELDDLEASLRRESGA